MKKLLLENTNLESVVKLVKLSPRQIRASIRESRKSTHGHSYKFRKNSCSKIYKKAVVNLGYRCDSIDFQWELICSKDKTVICSSSSSSISGSSGQSESHECFQEGTLLSRSSVDQSGNLLTIRKLNCNGILSLDIVSHVQFLQLALGNNVHLVLNRSGGSSSLLPCILIRSDVTNNRGESVMLRRDYNKLKLKPVCPCMRRICQNDENTFQALETSNENLSQDKETSHIEQNHYEVNVSILNNDNFSQKCSITDELTPHNITTNTLSLTYSEKEPVSSHERRCNETEKTVEDLNHSDSDTASEGQFQNDVSEDLIEGQAEQGVEITTSTELEMKNCTPCDETPGDIPMTLSNYTTQSRNKIRNPREILKQSQSVQNGSFIIAPGVNEVALTLKQTTGNALNDDLSPKRTDNSNFTSERRWSSPSNLLAHDMTNQDSESSTIGRNISNTLSPVGLRHSLRCSKSVIRLNYGRESPKREKRNFHLKEYLANKKSTHKDVHLIGCIACNKDYETMNEFSYCQEMPVRARHEYIRKKPFAKKSSRHVDGYVSEYLSCNEDTADDGFAVRSCAKSSDYVSEYSSCNEDTVSDLVAKDCARSSEVRLVESAIPGTGECVSKNAEISTNESAVLSGSKARISDFAGSLKTSRKSNESNWHNDGYFSEFNPGYDECTPRILGSQNQEDLTTK